MRSAARSRSARNSASRKRASARDSRRDSMPAATTNTKLNTTNPATATLAVANHRATPMRSGTIADRTGKAGVRWAPGAVGSSTGSGSGPAVRAGIRSCSRVGPGLSGGRRGPPHRTSTVRLPMVSNAPGPIRMPPRTGAPSTRTAAAPAAMRTTTSAPTSISTAAGAVVPVSAVVPVGAARAKRVVP